MLFNDGTYWNNLDINDLPVQSIENIAHALSNICRYGGHVDKHYSVAQHSLAIARLAPDKYFLEALLHDASEAYIGDIPAPMKAQVPEIKKFEEKIQKKIFEAYNLVYPIPEEVEYLDSAITRTEMHMFFEVDIPEEIDELLLARTNNIREFFACMELTKPWSANKAKRKFLQAYENYNRRR